MDIRQLAVSCLKLVRQDLMKEQKNVRIYIPRGLQNSCHLSQLVSTCLSYIFPSFPLGGSFEAVCQIRRRWDKTVYVYKVWHTAKCYTTQCVRYKQTSDVRYRRPNLWKHNALRLNPTTFSISSPAKEDFSALDIYLSFRLEFLSPMIKNITDLWNVTLFRIGKFSDFVKTCGFHPYFSALKTVTTITLPKFLILPCAHPSYYVMVIFGCI